MFGPKDTDMTVQLTRIKETAAQALGVRGTNSGPAVIARSRAQLTMTLPLSMSHGVASKEMHRAVRTGERQKDSLVGERGLTFGGHAWDAMILLVRRP
jgi:hypothetical protein